MATRTGDYDYIIVGSGAGGGPLAANLAKAGYTVLLLEAGGDPCLGAGQSKLLYEVPIFHGLSTENPECQWDYFVKHYSEKANQVRDSKIVIDENGTWTYSKEHGDPGDNDFGVWYPRAGTLGGCTAHNAMITVTPQDVDWNRMAELTGDDSWRAEKMNGYFARLENCTYKPRPGSFAYMAQGVLSSITGLFAGRKDWQDWAHGHGFDGWLTTSEADPRLVAKDPQIIATLLRALAASLGSRLGNPALSLATKLDPNDTRNSKDSKEGIAFTPLAVAGGKRNGPREFLLRTAASSKNLTIQLHALASKVLFDGRKATGVEFYEGEHLYEADPQARQKGPGRPKGTRRTVTASREVIVCGGAFNSPQLLKLSGVGPRAELEKWGIPVVVDLPGVGENLQDRYEVGVVSEFERDFALLKGVPLAPPTGADDPYIAQWRQGKGLYTSNGALVGILKRSNQKLKEPDLYIFALPGYFKGYYPTYSSDFERNRNLLTWAVLKAYTENTAGRVTLRGPDPAMWPLIEFKYFDEGNDKSGADLDAVVDGVNFVRNMNRHMGKHTELVPGEKYENPEALKQFIKDEAWGHHASCTNKIGRDDDPMAVLDSRFRVRGTQGLRVVDASVFPRIPGYFIVSAVYMVSEKASDVIAEDAESRKAMAAGA